MKKQLLVIIFTFLLSQSFVLANGHAQEASEGLKTRESAIEVIDFKEVDITDVIKFIALKSGANIVAGSNVTGKVTLYLKDVTVQDVLKIMAQTNDLAFIREGQLIRVMTGIDYEKLYGHKFFDNSKRVVCKLSNVNAGDIASLLEKVKSPEGTIIIDGQTNTLILNDLTARVTAMQNFVKELDVPRITEVFELSYAKVEEMTEKITPMLTANVGTIRSDKRCNKIFVTDTSQRLKEIEHLIKEFDVKEKEVSIQARIVQVILSDQYRMGVNWQGVIEKYRQLSFVSNFDVLGNLDKKGEVSIGTLEKDDYSAVVQALQQFGTTNNLSSPHIIAVNNQEAKILVGSTEPYVTTATTTPSSGPVTTAETVNFIEVGVKLYVTPMIHKDGFVTMKIRPEVSSVTRNLTTSNNNTIPVVETSEAETTVLVKDGVTIVIGGLMKDEKINTDKHVPILGKIPFLGAAFRSKDHLTRKTELVIFLTPRIISGDVMAPDYKTPAMPLPQ